MAKPELISQRSKRRRHKEPLPARYKNALKASQIDSDAVKVLQRLTQRKHKAYLVGGGVRDLLLGYTPKDFDIATSAHPNEVRSLFHNCRLIGKRFRLAHIIFSREKIIEVATFRKDPSQKFIIHPLNLIGDNKNAVRISPERRSATEFLDLLIRHDNSFGAPHEDAIRRDFSINGLYFDLEKEEIIDYVGGMPDLQQGIIRSIGDPDIRFREDPIRILRAIKFSARLDMGIDPETYHAMMDYRRELRRAAKPRLLEEIFRLLRGKAAHRSIYLTWETGILAEILPELSNYIDNKEPLYQETWSRLMTIDRMARQHNLPSDPVLLASLLLGPILQSSLNGNFENEIASFLNKVGARLSIPRKIREDINDILNMQHLIQRNDLRKIKNKALFYDASVLFHIIAAGRGEFVPVPINQKETIQKERRASRRMRRPQRKHSQNRKNK